MDSLITTALAVGDHIGALNRGAPRDDVPALLLRGVAMAQLGDLARAKALLRRAARATTGGDVIVGSSGVFGFIAHERRSLAS